MAKPQPPHNTEAEEALPGNPTVGSYLSDKAPVLWLDVDNGLDRTERRFAALIEGHGIPQEAPLRYASFPQPPFAAGDPGSVMPTPASIQKSTDPASARRSSSVTGIRIWMVREGSTNSTLTEPGSPS